MKVKTNIRAGKKSGTVQSNSDLGISGRDPNKPPSDDTPDVTPAPTPVVYYRCVGV